MLAREEGKTIAFSTSESPGRNDGMELEKKMLKRKNVFRVNKTPGVSLMKQTGIGDFNAAVSKDQRGRRSR